MAKRSEVQAELDRLTKELETAEDDSPEEVWVEKDGHRTKLVGARATSWLRKHGYADDDSSGAGEGDGNVDGKPVQDDKPPSGHAYFRGRGKAS
jgi:hypothetical protein